LITVAVVDEPPRRKGRRLLALALVPALVAIAVNLRRMRARRALQREHADVGFMYAMHNAMRRDLSRLERSVATVATASHSPGLRAGFDLLRKELMSHHEAEDSDLWPVLRAHLDDPGDLAQIDAMVAEHAAIPAALDAVGDALASDDDARPAVSNLTQLVRDHLAHEERTVLPLLQRHISSDEWHVRLRHERNKQPMRNRAEFIGWVLDEASEDDEAAVMAEIPPPGRVVIRHVIQPRYARRDLWEPVAT
jgi:iron-sulfur cluster repair protein YtfE (RIC family)